MSTEESNVQQHDGEERTAALEEKVLEMTCRVVEGMSQSMLQQTMARRVMVRFELEEAPVASQVVALEYERGWRATRQSTLASMREQLLTQLNAPKTKQFRFSRTTQPVIGPRRYAGLAERMAGMGRISRPYPMYELSEISPDTIYQDDYLIVEEIVNEEEEEEENKKEEIAAPALDNVVKAAEEDESNVI